MNKNKGKANAMATSNDRTTYTHKFFMRILRPSAMIKRMQAVAQINKSAVNELITGKSTMGLHQGFSAEL